MWRRKSMLLRCGLGVGLGASIVACALLAPPVVVVPLLAVGLWVWFEIRHAKSKRMVRAGHPVPGRGRGNGVGPPPPARDGAAPARHDPNREAPPNAHRVSPGTAGNDQPTRRPSPERPAPQNGQRNHLKSRGAVANVSPALVRDDRRPRQTAANSAALPEHSQPAPQALPPPQAPTRPAPKVARRAAGTERPLQRPRPGALEQQLRDWLQADPQNRTSVYQSLRDNLRTQARSLDLTPVPVLQLPDCLARFGHLEALRIRPHVLRHNRLTDGPMPLGGHGGIDLGYVRENLRAWAFLSGATAEQAKFFERHFVKGSAHIDLRGLNLPSIPDVLASYPSLNSVSMSPRLLQRVVARKNTR